MCGQMNCCCRRSCCGMTRQSTGCPCGCRACDRETAAPTATISMADFEHFVLVPTSVFDQGDVDCDCDCDCGCCRRCDCDCDW